MDREIADYSRAYDDFQFSNDVKAFLLNIELEMRKEAGRFWSTPIVSMGDDFAKCSLVEYLKHLDFFPECMIKEEEKCKSFSIVNTIYLELVIALLKIGMKSGIIKKIQKIFSVPYKDEKAFFMGIGWLEILLLIQYGVEIELLISMEDESIVFCDSLTAVSFLEKATNGQIRISLSRIINDMRKRNGSDGIEMSTSFTKVELRKVECNVLREIRNLANEEEITIRKATKDRLLINTKRKNKDEELKKDLEKLMQKHSIKDFTDVFFAVRQGGVAYVKETDSKIFDK